LNLELLRAVSRSSGPRLPNRAGASPLFNRVRSSPDFPETRYRRHPQQVQPTPSPAISRCPDGPDMPLPPPQAASRFAPIFPGVSGWSSPREGRKTPPFPSDTNTYSSVCRSHMPERRPPRCALVPSSSFHRPPDRMGVPLNPRDRSGTRKRLPIALVVTKGHRGPVSHYYVKMAYRPMDVPHVPCPFLLQLRSIILPCLISLPGFACS
jgi:hypothetical protein